MKVERTTIEIGDGIRLVPPTREALSYIQENFRAGDKMEHDFFGGSLKVQRDMPAWVIMYNDMIIGAGGFSFPTDGGYLSDARVIWFLTCENVNRVKLTYVKNSRRVMRAMVATLPSWVRLIMTAPMADYRMAVKWDREILGFHERYRTSYQGAEFVIMTMLREEV